MQKKKILLLTVVSTMLFTSCSKLGPLSADNFTVTPDPLETRKGAVPATVNGQFPEKYMNKKAVITIIPELRYANGQRVQGNTATFQGENVADNNQVIAYRTGGSYTLRTNFPYADCNKAELYMTFDARMGSKQVTIPEVKVADGVIATSELYRRTVTTAQPAVAPDAYQRITKKKQEANIRFLIQQANLRKSELKNNSVKEFVKMLKQINDDREGLNLDNVEVSAYASPDGGFSINDKLANERQKVSEQYVNQELRKIKMNAPVDAKYTAQDWEGFQELVKSSNIQDKDIILRVLAMYKDPQEREQQIKNISSAFRELADGILPQLRRSRLIINYETIGRSDEQILDQIKASIPTMPVPTTTSPPSPMAVATTRVPSVCWHRPCASMPSCPKPKPTKVCWRCRAATSRPPSSSSRRPPMPTGSLRSWATSIWPRATTSRPSRTSATAAPTVPRSLRSSTKTTPRQRPRSSMSVRPMPSPTISEPSPVSGWVTPPMPRKPCAVPPAVTRPSPNTQKTIWKSAKSNDETVSWNHNDAPGAAAPHGLR